MSFQGPLGLDDPDRMRADLEAATGLTWRAEEVHQDNVLVGGLTEILLMAVVSKTTEMAVSASVDQIKEIVEKVKAAVKKILDRQMNPPTATEPTVEPVPDPEPQDDIQDAIPTPENVPATLHPALPEPGA